MGALLISVFAVAVGAVVPFVVEIYKGTRATQEQSYIAGISACAELAASAPGTPAGYCHLKYVIINQSQNAIHDVIVVQPRWRPQHPISVINAGTRHEEEDLTLRRIDPGFTSYPVGIIFKDGQGRVWHKHHVAERVRKAIDPPRTVHDYVPHKNPLGMTRVSKWVGGGLASLVLLGFLTFGIISFVDNWKTREAPGSPNQSAGSHGR